MKSDFKTRARAKAKAKVKVRLLSIVLVLAMLCGGSVLPFSVSAKETENGMSGDGSAEYPYLISSAEELSAFRDKINAGASVELCALLTDDIDLGGAEWIPIYPVSGYITEAYAGTFDGGGHKISGLKINSENSNVGLFGAINGATVKNLEVEGNVFSSNNYVGGIVGKIQQGSVENCSFRGSVTTAKAGGYAGGIAGYTGNSAKQNGNISGCSNFASVQGGCIGGITGYAKFSAVTDCYNTGVLKGTGNTGGIVGQNMNNTVIKNCYSSSDEISGGANTGGIAGFNGVNMGIANCYWKNPEGCFAGGMGSASDSGRIEYADGLTAKLGEAFCEDEDNINGGYPILLWQSGGAVAEKDPKIEIVGKTALYMTNSSEQVYTTLSVNYIDCENEPEIVWNVLSGAENVRLEKPENAGENNASAVVYAEGPGKSVISAETADGLLYSEIEISIVPFVTTVELDGIPAVGETVYAKVNILGGGEYDYENYPELSYCWKYLTAADYEAGNTGSSSYKEIAGKTGRSLEITDELSECYLSFEVWIDREQKTPSRPLRIMSADEGMLTADFNALSVDTADIKSEKTIELSQVGSNGSKIAWRSSSEAVIDPENGKITLPESGITEITLTAELSLNGYSKTKSFVIKVYSEEAAIAEKNDKILIIENAVKSLGSGYTMYPVYVEDKNVVEKFSSALKEESDADISVKLLKSEEIYGGADIDENGYITYFYTDPNSAPAIHFGSYRVTFELSLGDAKKELEVPVIIYWDADKVKKVMSDEILSKVEIPCEEKITDDIVLPKAVDGKLWTLVSWTSSDENTISVSSKNQQSPDTLFDPYVGVVRRGSEDKKVILTASFVFGFTNDINGNEPPIVLNKVFEVTVAAIDAETAEKIRSELLQKLENGFEKSGFRDAVTGKPLDNAEGIYTASHDILFPTTNDFGVDGKYYPVTVTSGDEDVIVSPDVDNAARATVIRPAPGKDDARTAVTVSISDKDTNISASHTFEIYVPAITSAELEAEKALMNKAAEAYFDGIRGENAKAGNIMHDLLPFFEVYEENGELVWVRNRDEMKGSGIVPTALEGWETLEAWRIFKSSNPASVTHENLLVKIQKYAKAVTVSSALSSEIFGIYGKLYRSNPEKYADYADFAELYYREVSADIVVRGRTTYGSNPVSVAEKLTVKFSLEGVDGTLIKQTSYSNLDEPQTVFDIFKKAMSENGFSYKARGSYVYSVTDAYGNTLSELDMGENSGWIYRVNGKIAEDYMGAHGLRNGDVITVFYTDDYTKEYDFSNASSVIGKSDAKTDDKKQDSDKNENGEPDTAKPVFKDISGHWAEPDIMKVYNLRLMNGVSESEFAPQSELSRAMFVTVLYRIENEPEADTAKFSDVPDDGWYAKAVAWASKNRIVNGISENEFAPDAPVTREQAATILFRYAEYKGFASDVPKMPDYKDSKDISEYAEKAVGWASVSGIMNGNDDGTFAPKSTSTRAQAAAMFARAAEKLK